MNTNMVTLVVDFKGLPDAEDCSKVFGNREALQTGNGERLGKKVQRWETQVRMGEIGDFVTNANHHPQVFRVQQKGFEVNLCDL